MEQLYISSMLREFSLWCFEVAGDIACGPQSGTHFSESDGANLRKVDGILVSVCQYVCARK